MKFGEKTRVKFKGNEKHFFLNDVRRERSEGEDLQFAGGKGPGGEPGSLKVPHYERFHIFVFFHPRLQGSSLA